MVERALCMWEVPGSIPSISMCDLIFLNRTKHFDCCFFFQLNEDCCFVFELNENNFSNKSQIRYTYVNYERFNRSSTDCSFQLGRQESIRRQ